MEAAKDEVSAIEITPQLPRELALKVGLDKQSNRNKARLYLAGLAIARLTNKASQFRTELFRPGGDHENGIKALAKEALARSWQSDFLEMLVAAGIANVDIQKTGHYYSLADVDKRKLLIENMLDGDQQGLRLLLWPKDYGGPTAAEMRAAAAQGRGVSITAEELSEDQQDEAQVVEEADDQLGVLGKVADSLKEVAGHLGELYSATEKTTATTAESSANLKELTDRMERGLQHLELLTNEEKRRIYGELGDLVSKAKETEIRKKSLFSQLESESRRSETTMQRIKELLERVN